MSLIEALRFALRSLALKRHPLGATTYAPNKEFDRTHINSTVLPQMILARTWQRGKRHSMGLRLSPLTAEDFSSITNHANIFEPGDDLVGPPVPVCWPVSTREEAQTRLQVHMEKQSQRYLKDPSVNYLKVIDDSGSILSVARWHWYPKGYSYEKEAHWETYPETALSEQWAKRFNIPLNNFILGSRDAARASWMEKDQPCWILMHMLTRSSKRGKGAARLLIQWGIEQAERKGVPAYLEAGVMGKPIYEKIGFRQVGELMELDLRPFGVETTFVMAKMAYFPTCGGVSSEEDSTVFETM